MRRRSSEGRSLGARLAGELHRYFARPRPKTLRTVPLDELAAELLARAAEGAFDRESTVLIGCQIQDALRRSLDVHRNRFSAARYRDAIWTVREAFRYGGASLDGATVVDVGCGSLNPYGTIFVLLLLGARRGIAVDLDPIQDLPRALQAIVDAAAMMLVDPTELAGDLPVSRDTVLTRMRDFDLARLRAGDPSGLAAHRLTYRRESIATLSLADGEADLVISNAVFEHLADVDAVVDELARVTRPGGLHIHTVDGSDHRRYADPDCHPLAFLTETGETPLTHGSNRLRPHQFVELFRRRGFEVLAFTPVEEISVDRRLRSRLVPPFRAMSDLALGVIGARLYLRRL